MESICSDFFSSIDFGVFTFRELYYMFDVMENFLVVLEGLFLSFFERNKIFTKGVRWINFEVPEGPIALLPNVNRKASISQINQLLILKFHITRDTIENPEVERRQFRRDCRRFLRQMNRHIANRF